MHAAAASTVETVALQGQPPRPAGRAVDRFLAFAFAAADLLVEADLHGTITFAAGAFRSRLGVEPADFVGRPLASLFAPAEAAEVAQLLAMAGLRGRVRPVVMRLADAAASAASVAALVMPAAEAWLPARISLSIGPVPWAEPRGADGQALVEGPRQFARTAEALLRDGAGGQLGLIEVAGLGEGEASAEAVRAAISEAAAGAAIGEMARGRYGLLFAASMELDAIVGRIDSLLQAGARTAGVRLSGTKVALERAGLPMGQAARALRYALGQFTQGGLAATEAAGGRHGLAGIIATAETRTLAMRETIAAGRFRLSFQPVVDLDDRTIHHFEALLRPLPGVGIAQSTQEFVTFAEAVGLSDELDWAVMTQAIEALAASRNASVAVNMSGLSMQSAAYRARLLGRIGELGDMLGPKGSNRLLVELTETAEIEDMAAAAASIDELRRAGVPVCLDDFGAGASAFRYLRAFGVDYVKIDGLYVRSAAASQRDRSFVASMVEIATSVGARVVAEMIETEEQARLMRDLGVQFGQGWLFGKPGRLPGAR